MGNSGKVCAVISCGELAFCQDLCSSDYFKWRYGSIKYHPLTKLTWDQYKENRKKEKENKLPNKPKEPLTKVTVPAPDPAVDNTPINDTHIDTPSSPSINIYKIEPNSSILTLNISQYPDLYEDLALSAFKHIRTIEHQAIAYIVSGIQRDNLRGQGFEEELKRRDGEPHDI